MKEKRMSIPYSSSVVNFHTALEQLCSETSTLAPLPAWLQAIQRLGVSLGGTAELLEHFAHVWRKLYSAALLLDHLQDKDNLDNRWIASLPSALQYHLALSAYAVAQHDLNRLSGMIAAARYTRLQAHWSTMVLQLAIGQYRDLTQSTEQAGDQRQVLLDTYEEIAAQKTGAAFALAFGGSAIVATDDATQIAAATNAGLIFGMLLQYHDDLLDAPAQAAQATPLTLARAWLAPLPSLADVPPLTLAWGLIYTHYNLALDTILAPLPSLAQTIVRELLQATFGTMPDLPAVLAESTACSAMRP